MKAPNFEARKQELHAAIDALGPDESYVLAIAKADNKIKRIFYATKTEIMILTTRLQGDSVEAQRGRE